MRWPLALLLGSGLLSAAMGCRNCDLVEAELRSRESALRELRADLLRAECQNEALLRELCGVKDGASPKLLPDQASQAYSLRQIVLGRGTGGYDDEHCPGDEALQIVLEPRDSDGHTIKAPGLLHVEALEISTEGVKIPLSSWDIQPDQVRRFWRNGLLSTGYFVVLPWKNWPSTEKVRVTARFILADGRLFEADKDVTVRVAPQSRRKPAPIDIPGPPLAEPEQVLPGPRKLEPLPAPSTQSWRPATHDPRTIQPAVSWPSKPPASIADSVLLLRPTRMIDQPGERP